MADDGVLGPGVEVTSHFGIVSEEVADRGKGYLEKLDGHRVDFIK